MHKRTRLLRTLIVCMSAAALQLSCGGVRGSDASLADLLGKYVDRYNVRNTIARIEQAAVDPARGFRFVVLGDNRSNPQVWGNIAREIGDHHPLFAIDVGDMVPSGAPRQFADYLLPTLEASATGYEFLPVIGNHDAGGGARAYEYLFGADGRVYHFHCGDSVFVILDNFTTSGMPWPNQLALADQWLGEAPNTHKFVFVHAPPANVRKWAYHAADRARSATLTRLMTQHAVDQVFCGHIHAYDTAELDGVRYTVTGGGGAPLDKHYGPQGSVYHFVVVDVTPAGVRREVVRF